MQAKVKGETSAKEHRPGYLFSVEEEKRREWVLKLKFGRGIVDRRWDFIERENGNLGVSLSRACG